MRRLGARAPTPGGALGRAEMGGGNLTWFLWASRGGGSTRTTATRCPADKKRATATSNAPPRVYALVNPRAIGAQTGSMREDIRILIAQQVQPAAHG